MANRWENSGNSDSVYFEGLQKITADGNFSHEIKRRLLLGRKVMTNLDSTLKSRDITLPTKVHLVKAMALPVVMYGSKSWTIKKVECWRTDAFELWCWRRLESSLNFKVIQPVNPKGNQSWIFIGRTDVEAETPILWPPDAKNWLIGKNPDAGKDWRREENGTTEDKMVTWHHQLNGHEFEQAPGFGDGQGSLERCSPWGSQGVGHDRVAELMHVFVCVPHLDSFICSWTLRFIPYLGSCKSCCEHCSSCSFSN